MTSLEIVQDRLLGFKDKLVIEVEGDFIVVRARDWLGSDNFAKISTLIKEINGEWVKMGKQSHWRVPVSTAVKGSAGNLRDRLIKVKEELDNIVRDIQ